MIKVKYIPILGDLVDATKIYFRQSYRILKAPLGFYLTLDFNNPKELSNSILYCAYGISAGFITLIPFFMIKGGDASKTIYVLKNFSQLCIHTYILHYCLLLFGSKQKKLRFTLIPQFYLSGLLAPLAYIVVAPLLLIYGPESFVKVEYDHIRHLALSTLELVYLMLATSGFLVLIYILIFTWYSKIHAISKFKVLGGLLLAGIPANLIFFFLLNPVLNFVEEKLGYINLAL